MPSNPLVKMVSWQYCADIRLLSFACQIDLSLLSKHHQSLWTHICISFFKCFYKYLLYWEKKYWVFITWSCKPMCIARPWCISKYYVEKRIMPFLATKIHISHKLRQIFIRLDRAKCVLTSLTADGILKRSVQPRSFGIMRI